MVERHDPPIKLIDTAMERHLYDLDQIKKGIGLRAYAQKDPKIEYQKESFAMFEQMMRRIREATVEYIFRIQIAPEPPRRVQPPPQGPGQARRLRSISRESAGGLKSRSASIPRSSATKLLEKLGRNDPCPCGSGKNTKMLRQ